MVNAFYFINCFMYTEPMTAPFINIKNRKYYWIWFADLYLVYLLTDEKQQKEVNNKHDLDIRIFCQCVFSIYITVVGWIMVECFKMRTQSI